MCYEALERKYRPLENLPLGKHAPISPTLGINGKFSGKCVDFDHFHAFYAYFEPKFEFSGSKSVKPIFYSLADQKKGTRF